MKYIIVLMSALYMFVMPVSGEQVSKAEQPIQGTRVKQVHSESKTVLSDDLDTFHVNSSHTPDHVIGQGGLEMPDSTCGMPHTTVVSAPHSRTGREPPQ